MNSKQLKLQCIHDIAKQLSHDDTKEYNYLSANLPYYKQAEELLNSGKIFLFLDKNKTGSKI